MYARLRRIYRFVATNPATKHRKFRTLGRFISWQVRSRLSDEVIVPWVGGSRFIAKRGMRGFTGNIYAGLADYQEMSLLLHTLGPERLFVDVGANVGSYTVLAAKACDAPVIAFEPDPASRFFIERNVALNKVSDRVSIRDEAVGNKPGEGFLTATKGTGNHLASDGTPITITTLDDALSETPFALKIDTERNDRAVLLGARRILSDPTLSIVITEDRPAFELLLAAGFTRTGYDPASRRWCEPSDGNGIFVRSGNLDIA